MLNNIKISINVKAILAMALLLFVPTLTQCFSKAIKSSKRQIEFTINLDDKIISNNHSQHNIINTLKANLIDKTKVHWILLLKYNQEVLKHFNLRIVSTESNLAPPETLEDILTINYYKKYSDSLI